MALTLGHVGYQLGGHMGGPSTGRGAFDPEAFPRIAAMRPFDWDRAFADALDALIEALAAKA